MSKIQILKAIHNQFINVLSETAVVSDVKDTNFESYSQQSTCDKYLNAGCQRYKFWKLFTTMTYWMNFIEKLFQMSKIQILKAIHNNACPNPCTACVVSDVKDTNFESYSQHFIMKQIEYGSCFRCQRYKFWKLFTTKISSIGILSRLFQMSKIQILKAIHNTYPEQYRSGNVVSDVKDTNFESYSQRDCWKSHKITRCFRCQRYKFWKLFTTSQIYSRTVSLLFQMSKIQILKAIHNISSLNTNSTVVVSDVKDTNFESYSQLVFLFVFQTIVVSDVKDTNFESYSQRIGRLCVHLNVVSDVKDTNFESYSQLRLSWMVKAIGQMWKCTD